MDCSKRTDLPEDVMTQMDECASLLNEAATEILRLGAANVLLLEILTRINISAKFHEQDGVSDVLRQEALMQIGVLTDDALAKHAPESPQEGGEGSEDS